MQKPVMETGGVGGGGTVDIFLKGISLTIDFFLMHGDSKTGIGKKSTNLPTSRHPSSPDIHLVYITSPTLESGFSLRTGETFLKSSASLIQGSVVVLCLLM